MPAVSRPLALLLAGGLASTQAFKLVPKSKAADASTCLNATAVRNAFLEGTPYHKYSEGFQDGTLATLFDSSHLGTTNKFYVEIGFDHTRWDDGPSNTRFLHELGWDGLLLDAARMNYDMNLYMEEIDPDTIAKKLTIHNVPKEPDYLAIDLTGCDLWVFLAVIKDFRPRVITVEYNSNYELGESVTNICKDAYGGQYVHHGDDIFGASLTALMKAGKKNGYTLVTTEKGLDVFFVREDLVCDNTDVNPESFRPDTGIEQGWRHVEDPLRQRWTITYDP